MVEDYLALVEAQHRIRPKYMAMLETLLRGAQAGYDAASEQPKLMSLDYAEGAQLDVIGDIVGVSRNYPYWDGSTSQIGRMDDAQYRLVIRATIAKNQWDGSFHSFRDTWNSIFSGLAMDALVVDNLDMSCIVYISGDFDDDIASLITAGYIFPKPMGVKMNYAVSPQGNRTGTVDEDAYYIGAQAAFVTGRTSVTAI
mgnify:CR=1 FL=1